MGPHQFSVAFLGWTYPVSQNSRPSIAGKKANWRSFDWETCSIGFDLGPYEECYWCLFCHSNC